MVDIFGEIECHLRNFELLIWLCVLYCIGLQDESECLLEYYFKIDFAQYAECN